MGAGEISPEAFNPVQFQRPFGTGFWQLRPGAIGTRELTALGSLTCPVRTNGDRP